jgi:GT2 family glycosyltransferase/ubiquinone/menaquinone biosynthesis C-methylase UbiE
MEFTGERYIPEHADSKDELSVEHLHRYNSVLPFVKNKVVLDIACGEGYGAALFAKTAKTVTGVDISEECILHANRKYNSKEYPNLNFKKGSVIEIPVENNSFDVVVSFETIEHVSEDDQKQFLSEVKRILKKGGVFIISTPDEENYSKRYEHKNEFHLHELTRQGFKDLLSRHFEYTRFFEQNFEIVSAIVPAEYGDVEELRLITWQNSPNAKKGKYLICVGSDKAPDGKQLGSIVLETDKDYFKQIDRILQLQDEVESRSKWALSLDAQRIQHEAVINDLNEQIRHQAGDGSLKQLSEKIEQLQKWLIEQDKEKQLYINSLTAQVEQYAKRVENNEVTINSLESQITESKAQQKLSEDLLLRQVAEKGVIEEQLKLEKTQTELLTIRNNELNNIKNELDAISSKHAILESQVKEKEKLYMDIQFNYNLAQQQLSELNTRLNTIYYSDGWKGLQKYYNLKGKFLNENSAHYKALRRTLNFLRGRKQEKIIPVPNLSQGKRDATAEVVDLIDESEIPIRSLPYFEHPVVSIIIPVYNAWIMNEKCITSIINNTTDVSYEVILADDQSTDPTKNISRYFQNILHIRNDRNLGFLLNVNNAASHARGKYIHLLNNDTEVRPGWLSSLVMLMERDEQIGMVGSKLIYPDGRLQEAGGIIWNDASGWNFGHSKDPDLPEFNYVKEVDYISGASIMVRKDLWKELGGFDTLYTPAYCEDSDMAFAIRQKGFKVMYQPLSEVIHYEGYSHGTETAQSTISSIKEYQQVNNKKFFEKWKAVLQRDQFPNAENVFWARDRSKGKKTVLMVDHYVPHFDKDAGSRTTFQYLQLLVKLGYNVKFLGENFYKHEPYTTVLQQMGIEVLYGPWYANNWKQWFLDNKEKFDYIYLNRPHITINFIDFFKQNSSARIIYYGHDLHFMRELKQYEIEKDEALLKSSEKWKETETYIFNNSDIILAPSDDEKKLIQGLGINGKVFSIRPYMFEDIPPAPDNFGYRKHILFVGGFNHKPNVDAISWFVKEIWPGVRGKLGQIKFLVVGSNVPKEIQELAGNGVEIKGFVSDDELKSFYNSSRLAVIPLRYGAGVKGKTVEAMFFGIPLVTTSYGIEGLPGDFSFIHPKNDAASFIEEVVSLYRMQDDQLAELSKKEVTYIKNNFHLDIAKAELLGILNGKQ